MKIDTCTAARELRMHPAELIVKLWNRKLIHALEDFWPQIEQDLVERLSQVEGISQRPYTPGSVLPTDQEASQKEIIRVMRSHGCWGHNRIGKDQLKKFLPHDTNFHNLPKDLKKLCAKGLIREENNSYSLNNNKKSDIDLYIGS